MSTLKLAFKNLAQRPLRTILAILTVSLSIILLLSLLGFYFGYNKAMNDELKSFGVQMLAVPKGCPYSSTTMLLHGGVIPNKLPLESLNKMRAIEHVKRAEGIVMGTAEIGGQTSVVYGVTPGFEALRTSWRVDGEFAKADGETVVGSALARKLGLKVGDTLSVEGIAQDKAQQEALGTYPAPGTKVITYKTGPWQLKVVGILDQTGASEDNFLIPSADMARKIVDLNGLTAIAIEIDSQPDSITFVSTAVEGINDAQPVTISQVKNTIAGLVQSAQSIMLSVTIVAILACAIVVAGSSMMGVIERSKEIGMMRSIGATPFQVSVSVMLEVIMLTLIGGLIGIGITIVLQGPLSDLIRIFIPNAPNAQLVILPWTILLMSVGIAIGVGFLAAVPPLFSVAKAPPLKMAGS